MELQHYVPSWKVCEALSPQGVCGLYVESCLYQMPRLEEVLVLGAHPQRFLPVLRLSLCPDLLRPPLMLLILEQR